MNRLMVIGSLCLLPLWLQAGEPDGTLVADGNSANTYQTITSAGYMYECPDESRDHASHPFQHIQQTYDADLGKDVFQFFIHALIDDDRGIESTTDRQRNEIKTWDKSPAYMVGQEGDSLTIQWKFKLPLGMLTTNRFTHIHQLKGIDNQQGTADVSMPLVTFTCCTSGSGPNAHQVLQVRHNNRTDGMMDKLAEVDLGQLLGRWISVIENFRVGEKGYYSVTLTDMSTQKVIVSIVGHPCDMWRTDCAGIRPKWGIYRYIGENRSMENVLRDEELRYADFSIRKVKPTTGIRQTEMSQATRPHYYNLLGCQTTPLLTRQNEVVYIYKGKKFLGNK